MTRPPELISDPASCKINFSATLEDQILISKIADRMHEIATEYKRRYHRMDLGDIDKIQLIMDVLNVHLNGRPLHLLRFLIADATDFQHDMLQIHLHVNRLTGGIPFAVPLRFATNGEHPA